MCSPFFQLFTVQDVGRSPRAIEQDNFSILLAPRKKVVQHWTQWRQTDPTCYNHDIIALGFLNWPVTAERTPHPQSTALFELVHGLGHYSDLSSCMHQYVSAIGIAADGNRDFSNSENINHIELSGQELEFLGTIGRPELESEGVVGFLSHPLHDPGKGEHGI